MTPDAKTMKVPFAATAGKRGWLGRRGAIALGAAAVGSGLLVYWRPSWLAMWRPALAFAKGDGLFVADVQNLSGDDAFDQSLNAALEVALAPSLHVNVFPTYRLRATLKRLNKPLNSPIDPTLAAELAIREAQVAVLAVTIELRGAGYLLSAHLIDPATQQVRIRESAEATERAGVLAALDQLALQVRRRLGEPRREGSEPVTPLTLATSASLDALKLYARSLRLDSDADGRDIELLQQAITLDPDFALALAALATRLYEDSSRDKRAEGERLFARALALPQRLSLRDRLWLYPVSDDARERREEAVNGYKAFLARYPNDTRAWFRLGWSYMATLNRLELAVEAFRRVVALDARHAAAWTNLATCYGGMGQHGDAVATYQKAFDLSPDLLLGMHVNGEFGGALVQLGRLDDAHRAFERMSRAPDAKRQARGRRSMAFLLMYRGRYHDAMAEIGQAIQINQHTQQELSLFRDHLIRSTIYLALGAKGEARREMAAVNTWVARLSLGPVWLFRVVAVRARLGEIDEVQRLITLIAAAIGNAQIDSAIGRNLSSDHGYLDLARAELDLLRGRARSAVAHLAAASERVKPEHTLGPSARAHDAAGQLDAAVTCYEQLLRIAPFGFEEQEDVAAAHVALAGIYQRQGRKLEARAQYQKLAVQWKDGDTDLVLLKQVHMRLGALAKS